MLKFNRFFGVLESLAPLKLSELSIADGGYDNSGIIVKNGQTINDVLFSLDLSDLSVQKAVELGCDTIVTHHPAIYYPIKNLSIDGENSALLTAIKNRISVISMHLNLDIADKGIDACLASGLGAKDVKILELVDETHGYGREFDLGIDLIEFVENIKREFSTDRVIYYGNGKCNKVASFCGGGASHALKAVAKGVTNADTIVTSDLAHHEIKEIIEKNKNLIILPHYVSEEYGFKKFYQCVTDTLGGEILTRYFQDKRFM